MNPILQWMLDNIVSIITLIVAPAIAYYFSRRKQKAEIDKMDAETTGDLVTSSGQLVHSWQEFADAMKEEYAQSAKQNKELLSTNRNLLATNNDLVSRMEQLEINMKAYMSGIEQLFEILVIEIEKTNPDLAKTSRDRFSVVSKIFD
jgi:hypothetical protein